MIKYWWTEILCECGGEICDDLNMPVMKDMSWHIYRKSFKVYLAPLIITVKSYRKVSSQLYWFLDCNAKLSSCIVGQMKNKLWSGSSSSFFFLQISKLDILIITRMSVIMNPTEVKRRRKIKKPKTTQNGGVSSDPTEF